MYDEIAAHFLSELTIFLSDSASLIQVMSGRAGKESALKHFLSTRGISPDKIVVFGDDTPDIGMLRTFEHSVAMGNASAAVKEAAKYVTASNDEDGIAHALHEFFGF